MIFSTKTTKRIFVNREVASPEQTTGAPVKPLYHSMEQSPQLLIRHTASGIPTKNVDSMVVFLQKESFTQLEYRYVQNNHVITK